MLQSKDVSISLAGLEGSRVYSRFKQEEMPKTDPFSGLYLGSFGPHGPEILQLKRSVTEASQWNLITGHASRALHWQCLGFCDVWLCQQGGSLASVEGMEVMLNSWGLVSHGSYLGKCARTGSPPQ